MIILKLGVPAIVCTLIFYLQEIINLVFAGHMDNKVMLASIGLGNMINNCVVLSTIVSLNSAVETLVTQAVGGGHYELCG